MKNCQQYKMLKYSVEDSICSLVIDREKYLNALSKILILELIDFFEWAILSQDIKVIIVCGAGEKSFVAGADIKEMSDLGYDYQKVKAYSDLGQRLTMKIENSSKPIIAAVNGYALGGGCELAMACHVRYASSNAQFGQPEVGLGLIAGFGGTQRLSRLIGKGHAMELLLSGEIINSNRALEIKLINKVLDSKNRLLSECNKLAKRIIKNSPSAIRNTIQAINKGESKEMIEALSIEADIFAQTFSNCDDAKEGITSFLNKKKPDFSGE